jgi:hypothetical protein
MPDDREELVNSITPQEGRAPTLRPIERGQPGRPENVNPELVPLLRYKATPERIEGTRPWLLVPDDHNDGPWAPRSTAGGLALSASFWVALTAFLG